MIGLKYMIVSFIHFSYIVFSIIQSFRSFWKILCYNLESGALNNVYI